MRWKIAQWFEQRWWKRYLADKNPQDYLDWKKSYWKSLIAKLDLEHPNAKTILDAGCGPAGIFIHLEGNQVTATDPLIDGYENHLHHFNKSNYPWADFYKQTLEEINFKESFDLVYCLNVINHVKDIDRSYDNLFSAIKPGRSLILSIDSHNYTLPKLLFRLLPLDILHPHQYKLKEYERHLTERGLKILRSIKIKSGFLFDYYAIVSEKL